MSESWYVNQHIQAFSSSHPYAEGWKVYELPSGPARKRFFHYLLDFLRDRHPGAVERRTTGKGILDEELVETPVFVHPADPVTNGTSRRSWIQTGGLDGFTLLGRGIPFTL